MDAIEAEAWDHLLAGLALLSRERTSDISPLHCEHDELWVMSDATKYTPEELEQLDAWGFFPNEDGDGGFKSYRFGSA